ncbi:ATP-NAD kinase family protein [Gudongella sp. DL1XJH-153]|uniref:ATP-NAD kinase family protein n=1 Tax=Gudongella sp. DL1XJH-153 TaxID=3409804 RepID=UPI003BB72E1D
MSTIGIIANPASGKDIRRLVSHATVVDNNEKVNIVKRIILAAQGAGITEVVVMPDTFLIGYKAGEELKGSKELRVPVEILEMRVRGSVEDTILATKLMEEKGVNCIIALGGDGTSRAVAKSITATPLISISTGTNNVYPEMLEGTVVGIAAAAISTNVCDMGETCRRDKRIEIYKGGEMIDIALVDCVISKQTYIGSKAIWKPADIQKVIVSRANPASIGFSTIVGVKKLVNEEDDFGASINVNIGDNQLVAPIAAGTMKAIRVDEPIIHPLGELFSWTMEYKGIMALDGEREIPFKKGDTFQFKITRDGPYRVNIKRTIMSAQKNGFFNR